jgi:hypothetical protein
MQVLTLEGAAIKALRKVEHWKFKDTKPHER